MNRELYTNTLSRRRGRPPGSGKDDAPLLDAVADLLVSDPTLRPTTAIKRVIYTQKSTGTRDESLTRRLQGKWRAQADDLLQKARERRAPTATPDKQNNIGKTMQNITAPFKNNIIPKMTPVMTPELLRSINEIKQQMKILSGTLPLIRDHLHALRVPSSTIANSVEQSRQARKALGAAISSRAIRPFRF